jgi:hypothetical protein
MKIAKEPKAVTEVRRIRRELQEEARHVGRKKYHQMLNRRRDWFLGAETPVVREKPARKYSSQSK